MLPAPMVFPNDQFPVCAPTVVRLLEDPPLPGTATSGVAFPPLGVCPAEDPPLATTVPVADMYELFRDCPVLEVDLRVSRVESVRLGGGLAYDRSREELRRDDVGRATLVVS